MVSNDLEADIVKSLVIWLQATGLDKAFLTYKENFDNINPVLQAKDSNVVYVTEFREGQMVKSFLRGKMKDFPEESAKLSINMMISDWQAVTEYALEIIKEKKARENI